MVLRGESGKPVVERPSDSQEQQADDAVTSLGEADQTVQAGDESPQVGRVRTGDSGRRAQTIVGVVTACTAVAALVLSMVTWFDTHKAPRLVVSLPSILRISPTSTGGILYLQPNFSVVDKSESSILVSRMRVDLMKGGGEVAPPPAFYWMETGEFYYTSENREWNYRLKGDATPLVISQAAPQSPLGHFEAWTWSLSAGQWDGALVILGEDGQELARKPFCITITDEWAAELMALRPVRKFIRFGNDQADGSRSAAGPCYS